MNHGFLRGTPPLAALLSLALSSAFAAPPGPEPQVPEGGTAPGAFPNTSVSSVHVIANGSNTGYNSNVEVTGFEGQGPIPWTVNRYNRGDFALRLAPADAEAALSNLDQGFIDFADNTPELPASHAWRPSPALGVIIPTARQNGPIDWGDGEGAFYPTIAISESSSGPGYNMIDGSFGTGNFDLNTGRAGNHGSGPESNFAFSATWFPYDQGWLGGEIGTPLIGDPNFILPDGTSRWTGPNNHAAGLVPGLVKWIDNPPGFGLFGGLADLRIPGVDSLSDGMLFATSSDGGSDVNIVGVAPKDDGTGWIVTIREDSAADAETLAAADQSEFQFVYIPFDSTRLIGGHIVGATGSKRVSAGEFEVTRTGTGTYELTVPGKTGSDGTLLLQAAEFEAGTSVPLATRAFFSCEYIDDKFVIHSRKTTSETEAALADANFYVTWIDYETPLEPPTGPRLRSIDPVVVSPEGLPVNDANIGVHTTEPEILVITVDSQNFGGHFDPFTEGFAASAVIGRFVDPNTLVPTGEPFMIFASQAGAFQKLDVKFNPVSEQYVVVANARGYSPTANHVPMIALINPASKSVGTSPVANRFAYQPETTINFDDLSVGVSTANGNFVLVAEYSFPEEGEGAIGVLFDKEGTALTPEFSRLDLLQSIGDEDDPDVVYLPSRDVFLYIANTDNSNGSTGELSNRVVGAVFLTTPGPDDQLVTVAEQVLSDGLPAGMAEGHPASFENPFNGELLTAYDGGNGTAIGHLSFFDIGEGPAYPLTSIRDETTYLNGEAGTPFRHQHPQFAADPSSGVIVIGHNARDSDVGLPNGYVVTLLGPDGLPLPSQQAMPFYIAEAFGPIANTVNHQNIKYSPVSGSFIAVFHSSNTVYLASLEVTSSHLPSTDAPELAIQLVDGQPVLMWPSTATGYVLQFKTSLDDESWTNDPATPEVVEGMNQVTVTSSDEIRYYRLAMP